MAKTYDSRCYDLAEIFLSDEPSLSGEKFKKNLACSIQQTIEDEIALMRDSLGHEDGCPAGDFGPCDCGLWDGANG